MREGPKQHTRCVFHGRVQGVGFRYTTLYIAREYDVAGYVRNMPDGTVELVVEGSPSEIGNLITDIENQMGCYISRKTIDQSENIVGYERFDVTF